MIKVYKNVLSNEEIKYLNNTALLYLENNVLQEKDYHGRYTTNSVSEQFKFDKTVYDIAKKIRNAAGITDFKLEEGRGKDGINVAITIKDGEITWHKDPRSNNNHITYRCNVITQKSDIGGDLLIDNKIVELDVGDVHCYPVSEITHAVTASAGPIPRILWMFGTHVSAEQLKSKNLSELTWKEKILICKTCEFLVKPTYQCGKCGCFVHAKAILPKETCPLNKWK